MTTQVLAVPHIPIVPNGMWNVTSSLGSNTSVTMDNAGDKMMWVFPMPATIPDAVSFFVSSFTSTGTIDATLETLDSDGLPSGTPVTNSATASVSVTSTGVKTTATGLAGTASVTAGTLVALVLTATTGFAGNFTIVVGTGAGGTTGIPYSASKDTAGSWSSKQGQTTGGYRVGFKSGSSYIHVPGFAGAYSSFAFVNFSDSTNPDERANRFSYPGPVRVQGALIFVNSGSTPGPNDSYDVSLYTSHTSSPSQQRTASYDGDAQQQGAPHYVLFSTPYDVSANTAFAISIRATGSEVQSVPRWDYQANADLAGLFGTGIYSTSRDGGTGDFTDDNTTVYAILPLISGIDDATGGGGGSGGARIIGGTVIR